MLRALLMTGFYVAALACIVSHVGEYYRDRPSRYEIRRLVLLNARSKECNPAPAFPLKAGFDFLHGRSPEATRTALEAVRQYCQGVHEDVRALKPGTAQKSLQPQLLELHAARLELLKSWLTAPAGAGLESWSGQSPGVEDLRKAWSALQQRERDTCLNAGFKYTLMYLNGDLYFDGTSGWNTYEAPPWWLNMRILGRGFVVFFFTWLLVAFNCLPFPLDRCWSYLERLGWHKKILPAFDFSQRKHLYGCWALFGIVFLLTRAPYFLYYQAPIFSPDTPTYFYPLTDLQNGHWPNFGMRTPGYPLFIWAAVGLTGGLNGVIFFQHLLMFCASVFLLYALWRSFPDCIWPAALLLTAWCNTSSASHQDCALLTESLYTSLLMGSFALLSLGLRLERGAAIYFALYSLLTALVVLTRPAGLFMLVLVGTVCIYLIYLRQTWRRISASVLPCMVMLLGFCLYNQVLFGVFALSTVSGQVFAGNTWSYWEPDPEYPEALNTMIRRARLRTTDEERKLRQTSWDPAWLSEYLIRHNRMYYDDPEVVNACQSDPLQVFYWSKRLGRDAIRKHPDIFLRIGLANCWMYFFHYIAIQDPQDEDCLSFCYTELFIDKKIISGQPLLASLAAQIPPPPGYDTKGTYIRNFPSTLKAYIAWMCGLLRKSYLSWVYFAAFTMAGYFSLRARFRDREIFYILLLAAGVFGSGLINSFTVSPCTRYCHPMEFAAYLCLALLPVLSLRAKQLLNNPAQTIS